jgi:antitoxin HigA-1
VTLSLRLISACAASSTDVCGIADPAWGRRGPSEHRSGGLSLKESFIARNAVHPGEHLAEQLKALKMSAAELARQLQVPTNRITHILNGQRAITGDTALRLGHFFGTSAKFWLNLQKLYELRVAEQESGALIRALPRLRGRAA